MADSKHRVCASSLAAIDRRWRTLDHRAASCESKSVQAMRLTSKRCGLRIFKVVPIFGPQDSPDRKAISQRSSLTKVDGSQPEENCLRHTFIGLSKPISLRAWTYNPANSFLAVSQSINLLAMLVDHPFQLRDLLKLFLLVDALRHFA